ncbi:hypothetical protein [Krasilnikovia sp. MM14-A1259]|uniref:hypothetical protein n=1 Tax=Krasilnikovia sp. MM14-A1259 TaxID=3373539 RepID=UPI00382A29C6
MPTRQMLKTCQAVVDSLSLPRPFSVDALLDGLAVRRGRPIKIHTLRGAITADACGLWISTELSDDIFVEERTTTFHREHIILHEIGHLLCDHGASGGGASTMFARLLPDLDPALIRRFLARTNYTSAQEQEAELVASLIRTAAGTRARPPSSGVRGELERALGIRE